MVVVSGSLSRQVVKAFGDARFNAEKLPISSSLSNSSSATFELSSDAVEYMMEHGIIEQNSANHIASVTAKAYNKEREVASLAVKYL